MKRGIIGNLISPPRALLLEALASGEKSVGELVRETSLSQPNISNHLSRLRQNGIVKCRREGRRIFYRLTDPRLQRFVEPEPVSAKQPRLLEVYADYIDALYVWDIKRAESIVVASSEAGVGWKLIYMEILLPALRQLGDWWEAGNVTVAQEHAVTEMTRRLMGRLYTRESSHCAVLDHAPLALVGSVTGDIHTLGARMTADFLEDAGWQVIFLGGDVPQEEFVKAAEHHSSGLIALSVTCEAFLTVTENLLHYLRQRWRPDDLHILVGGCAALRFSEQLLACGADAVAEDPQNAAQLAAPWLRQDCARSPDSA